MQGGDKASQHGAPPIIPVPRLRSCKDPCSPAPRSPERHSQPRPAPATDTLLVRTSAQPVHTYSAGGSPPPGLSPDSGIGSQAVWPQERRFNPLYARLHVHTGHCAHDCFRKCMHVCVRWWESVVWWGVVCAFWRGCVSAARACCR